MPMLDKPPHGLQEAVQKEGVLKRPHLLRRLYNWVLHWAYTPHAIAALFIISFAESSFFPIPPDVLLLAMCLGCQRKAFKYATVCSVGSVLGGIAGFGIGLFLKEIVADPIINFYHYQEPFADMISKLSGDMNFYVFIAAFSPIPYKVFTIAAGVVAGSSDVNLPAFFGMFVLASAVGRSMRFFIEAALIYRYGDRIRLFIDRYFEWVALAAGILGVAGFVVIKYLI